MVDYAGNLNIYYVNHGSQPNYVYVDFGASERLYQTNLVADPAQINNVGAATLANGQLLLSYISSSGVTFALSSNGISFNDVSVPNASLGLPPGVTPNIYNAPALVYDPYTATVYVATVGTDSKIYMSSTTNGTSFTALTPGTPINGNTTVSQPSLTIYQSSPWVGFTTSSQRIAVVENILNPSATYQVSSYEWGNSNRNGWYAGINILGYGGQLYIFGQSTAGNQNLLETYTSNPAGAWSGQVSVSPTMQIRWTPSVLWFNQGTVYLTYQGNSNTNIHFTFN
jgi:hypothetical protein